MSNYNTLMQVMDKPMQAYSTKIFTDTIIKEFYQTWLVVNDGAILVKNVHKIASQDIFVKDLTISGKSLSDILKKIEQEWGILSESTNLTSIYSFKSNIKKNKEINGYALYLNLNAEHINSILEKGDYTFIDYTELEDIVKYFNMNNDFKESFYSLLYELDKRFGLHPNGL